MSWLTDAAEHLEDTLTGYAVGTTIFYSQMPDTPDACLALYDAGGSLVPEGADVPIAEHRLEVRCRAASESAARALAALVKAQLHGKVGLTMNSTTPVLWTRAEGEPAYLYADQRHRAIYLARFVLRTLETSYRSS